MKKSLLLLATFVFIVSSSIFAQTVTVSTYGVDPRDVASDLSVPKYFDRAYNGMQNVGIQVKVYLKGSSTVSLTGATWEFASKPDGSTADFGATMDLDTSNQIVTFIPDLVGRYKISFSDNGKSDTIVVDAATYLGLGAPASCKNCHGPLPTSYPYVYDKWLNTGHANIFREAMDGTLSNHYSPSCISCHTTGYDPDANNNGFDDRDFVYPSGPDSLGPNTWDHLLQTSPMAMQLANIQCESCHGPGSQHVNNPYDTKPQMVTLDVKNCAWCHDSGTHHAFPDQWKYSGYDGSEVKGYGFEGGHARGAYVLSADRDGCSPCHSGSGYVEWIKEGRPVTSVGLPAATTIRPPAINITCAVCHDPHDATNIHQLRAINTQLADSTQVTFAVYGTGAQCMDCHRARVNAVDYTSVVKGNAHFGPHHGPQADMLLGKNAPDFGIELPTSPHGVAGGNSCNDCHMAGALADAQGNINHVGGHSWNMSDESGKDFVEACASCHGDIGTSFADKKYYINGNADLDGNGVAEGLQIEVEGLMAKLSAVLPHDPNDPTTVLINTPNYENMELTPQIMKAGYAYMWIEEDRSLGVHNPAFTVSLLKASLNLMGVTAVFDYPSNSTMPDDYQLSQNYPNPFNPSTTINFSLPADSKVKIVVYDVTGAMVKVLVDGDYSAGNHEAQFNTNSVGNLASGIYFYQINAVSNTNGANFVQTKKMVLLK
jgi:hypothetical protein